MKHCFLFGLPLLIPALAFPVVNVDTSGFQELGTLSNNLKERLSISDTENELGLCRPVTIIFARGTIEPGNVGTLTGPPFFNALGLIIGRDNIGIQGVPYAATIGGYLAGGDSGGSENLASLTKQAVSQCPDTQIVLSGYSQGAQLVHNGVDQIPPEVAARVGAVVLFGDPFQGRPFPNIDASRVKTFCFPEDLICKDTIVVDTYHLAYAVDAVPAAQFVKDHVSV
ncbi:MAG: hypothetical protein Q9167_001235 [Letrouitia subvulpina]